MANHPSAAKRNRQRIKRTARNKTLRSALRTAVKKARAAVVSLARAASAGVIHRNAASRTTSRITSALSKRSSAS
jgi:small subunit ribosomal protein S20